jgi:hypothetical protein
LVSELGDGVFKDGCPVCKELCCCSNKSVTCERKHHCYRKCPATKSQGAKVHAEDKVICSENVIVEDKKVFVESTIEDLDERKFSGQQEPNTTGETGSTSCESISESVSNMPNNCLPCTQPVKKIRTSTIPSSSSASSLSIVVSTKAPEDAVVVIPSKAVDECIMVNPDTRPFHWPHTRNDCFPGRYKRKRHAPEENDAFIHYPPSYLPFDRTYFDPPPFMAPYPSYPMHPSYYGPPYFHNRAVPMQPLQIPQEDLYFYRNYPPPGAYLPAYAMPRSVPPPMMRHPVYYDQCRSTPRLAPTKASSAPLDETVPSESEGAMALLAMASSCNDSLQKAKSTSTTEEE